MKIEFPNAVCIGQVAVFYIPACKLDICLSTNITIREVLHDFFVKNYNAYTHEISNIQGFWVKQEVAGPILITDRHEKYEISFFEWKEKEFVAFLSTICRLIGEDSIYLTMGNRSWLVLPDMI